MKWTRIHSGLSWSVLIVFVCFTTYPVSRTVRRLFCAHFDYLAGWSRMIASVLAAWFSMYPGLDYLVVLFNTFRGVLYAEVKSLFAGRELRELARQRRIACFKCPLFYYPNGRTSGTCGKPGAQTLSGEPKGCWCITRLSRWIPSKKCWARTNGYLFGWIV